MGGLRDMIQLTKGTRAFLACIFVDKRELEMDGKCDDRYFFLPTSPWGAFIAIPPSAWPPLTLKSSAVTKTLLFWIFPQPVTEFLQHNKLEM